MQEIKLVLQEFFFFKSKRYDFDFLKFVFWVNLLQDPHEFDFFALTRPYPVQFLDQVCVFESMVVVAIQNDFYSEKYGNNVFLFFKNYF